MFTHICAAEGRIKSLEKSKKDKLIWWGLCIYAVILFILTFCRIFDYAFWADECYSILLLRMDFTEMIRETAADVHPPLYYIILRFVSKILGDNGAAFHLTSALPVGLTLGFSVTKIYRKFGEIPAILLATFVTFLDNALLFNVEVRMYSWANFLVLVSFYYFYEILTEGSKKSWICFSLFSLAAAYTHYYALIAVAFLYIMLIVYEIWKKGKTWKRTLAVCIIAVILYLPWLLNLLQAFGRTADSWWVEDIPKFRYCIQYLFSSKLSMLYVAVWAVSVMLLFYRTYIKKQLGTEYAFLVWTGLISICGTIAAGIGVSVLWRPMFQLKYVYAAAGVAWLVFGLAISKLKKNKLCLSFILFLTFIVCIPNYYNWVESERKCQFSTELILEYTAAMEEADVLLTNSGHLDWTILEYYYPENERVYLEEDESILEYLGKTEWLFLNKELEEIIPKAEEKAEKVVEGYLGPYNYVYVYRVRE